MIDKHKLETLLITNWASFFDIKKLMAFVAQAARDLPVTDEEGGPKGTRISLSRFEPTKTGFVAWVEFVTGTSVGTCEILITPDGTVTDTQAVGKRFKNSAPG